MSWFCFRVTSLVDFVFFLWLYVRARGSDQYSPVLLAFALGYKRVERYFGCCLSYICVFVDVLSHDGRLTQCVV